MKTCAICGNKLGGISPGARTKSRPTRRFGGVLCHSCVERVTQLKSRLDDGTIDENQVDLAYKDYVEQIVISLEPRLKREKPVKKKAPKKKAHKKEAKEKRAKRIKKRRGKK